VDGCVDGCVDGGSVGVGAASQMCDSAFGHGEGSRDRAPNRLSPVLRPPTQSVCRCPQASKPSGGREFGQRSFAYDLKGSQAQNFKVLAS
jgi:hypothetical protein